MGGAGPPGNVSFPAIMPSPDIEASVRHFAGLVVGEPSRLEDIPLLVFGSIVVDAAVHPDPDDAYFSAVMRQMFEDSNYENPLFLEAVTMGSRGARYSGESLLPTFSVSQPGEGPRGDGQEGVAADAAAAAGKSPASEERSPTLVPCFPGIAADGAVTAPTGPLCPPDSAHYLYKHLCTSHIYKSTLIACWAVLHKHVAVLAGDYGIVPSGSPARKKLRATAAQCISNWGLTAALSAQPVVEEEHMVDPTAEMLAALDDKANALGLLRYLYSCYLYTLRPILLALLAGLDHAEGGAGNVLEFPLFYTASEASRMASPVILDLVFSDPGIPATQREGTAPYPAYLWPDTEQRFAERGISYDQARSDFVAASVDEIRRELSGRVIQDVDGVRVSEVSPEMFSRTFFFALLDAILDFLWLDAHTNPPVSSTAHQAIMRLFELLPTLLPQYSRAYGWEMLASSSQSSPGPDAIVWEKVNSVVSKSSVLLSLFTISSLVPPSLMPSDEFIQNHVSGDVRGDVCGAFTKLAAEVIRAERRFAASPQAPGHVEGASGQSPNAREAFPILSEVLKSFSHSRAEAHRVSVDASATGAAGTVSAASPALSAFTVSASPLAHGLCPEMLPIAVSGDRIAQLLLSLGLLSPDAVLVAPGRELNIQYSQGSILHDQLQAVYASGHIFSPFSLSEGDQQLFQHDSARIVRAFLGFLTVLARDYPAAGERYGVEALDPKPTITWALRIPVPSTSKTLIEYLSGLLGKLDSVLRGGTDGERAAAGLASVIADIILYACEIASGLNIVYSQRDFCIEDPRTHLEISVVNALVPRRAALERMVGELLSSEPDLCPFSAHGMKARVAELAALRDTLLDGLETLRAAATARLPEVEVCLSAILDGSRAAEGRSSPGMLQAGMPKCDIPGDVPVRRSSYPFSRAGEYYCGLGRSLPREDFLLRYGDFHLLASAFAHGMDRVEVWNMRRVSASSLDDAIRSLGSGSWVSLYSSWIRAILVSCDIAWAKNSGRPEEKALTDASALEALAQFLGSPNVMDPECYSPGVTLSPVSDSGESYAPDWSAPLVHLPACGAGIVLSLVPKKEGSDRVLVISLSQGRRPPSQTFALSSVIAPPFEGRICRSGQYFPRRECEYCTNYGSVKHFVAKARYQTTEYCRSIAPMGKFLRAVASCAEAASGLSGSNSPSAPGSIPLIPFSTISSSTVADLLSISRARLWATMQGMPSNERGSVYPVGGDAHGLSSMEGANPALASEQAVAELDTASGDKTLALELALPSGLRVSSTLLLGRLSSSEPRLPVHRAVLHRSGGLSVWSSTRDEITGLFCYLGASLGIAQRCGQYAASLHALWPQISAASVSPGVMDQVLLAPPQPSPQSVSGSFAPLFSAPGQGRLLVIVEDLPAVLRQGLPTVMMESVMSFQPEHSPCVFAPLFDELSVMDSVLRLTGLALDTALEGKLGRNATSFAQYFVQRRSGNPCEKLDLLYSAVQKYLDDAEKQAAEPARPKLTFSSSKPVPDGKRLTAGEREASARLFTVLKQEYAAWMQGKHESLAGLRTTFALARFFAATSPFVILSPMMFSLLRCPAYLWDRVLYVANATDNTTPTQGPWSLLPMVMKLELRREAEIRPRGAQRVQGAGNAHGPQGSQGVQGAQNAKNAQSSHGPMGFSNGPRR